jgi:hypothetical protein
MASSLNAATSGGGGVIVTSDASGNLNIQSGGTTVAAVTSAGVAVTGTLSSSGASTFTGTGKFATTIGVGNATPAASGSGITFPATQSASSDANTLDDYEEGTFNPTVTVGTSGSITLKTSLDTLAYTKIGRIITITGLIGVASVSSPIGGVGISGLPFPIGTLAEDSEGIGIIILFQDAPSYVGSLITAVADQGVTLLTTSQVGSSVGADDQYRFSFSYFTD